MAQLVLQRGWEVECVLLESGAAVAAQTRLGEIGELPRQLLGMCPRGAPGHDPVRESHPQRLDGADRAPGEDEVECAGEPDQPWQPDGAAVDEWNAPPAAEDAEHRVLLADAQIAPERQLDPARDRVAGDARDHRLLPPPPRPGQSRPAF